MVFWCVFFFELKTAYEVLRSDWGSDVFSADLLFWGFIFFLIVFWFARAAAPRRTQAQKGKIKVELARGERVGAKEEEKAP